MNRPRIDGDAAAEGTDGVDCGADPNAALRTMFVDLVMGRRIRAGQDPVRRPVFLKPHGVAHGVFTIRPDLPEELRVGLLRHPRFPAWVRFSSDTLPTLPDLRTTVGIGIKLFDVPGEKLLEPTASTHDLLLQNHDVFFVDTARDMCEFTHAGVVDGDYEPYLREHPTTARILDEMAKLVPSLAAVRYWSALPYAFGTGQYAKYVLEPLTGDPAPDPDTGDPAYLHADLRERLLAGDLEFGFSVQLRTDPQHMPLDEATVRWDEELSLPVRVATLTLPAQDIDARGQATYGENLSFNPWQALADHAPVGSLAEARRGTYRSAAQLRRDINGIPVGEPEQPRPGEDAPDARDTTIVRAAIHPAIGIARVGNSEDGYVLAPELPDPPPAEPGAAKDETGALKRQAARFRVYGYNAAGEPVAELTADSADIRWTVHVANRKASWYEFQLALDVPEAADARPSRLRNRAVVGQDRAGLVIDPGAHGIRGRDVVGPEHHLLGEFLGEPVYLGELRTDAAGRLLFLGGRGVSASHDGRPAEDYANNDGWYDDTSDGPVTAEVHIDGRAVPVTPAWVVVAPPNYAPDVVSVRTVYDLLYDLHVRQGWLPFPSRVSFTRHVLPILQRFSGLQWVNHGFATQFGWAGVHDFTDPDLLSRLASDRSEFAELRRQVYLAFRDLDRDGPSPVPWPWIYGDAMSLPPVSARQHLALSPTQYRLLERWADGDFETDFETGSGTGTASGGSPAGSLEEVALAEQPATLDRAALTFCVADAFHPGCELTWPIRHGSLYEAPLRIRHRPAGEPEPDYGSELTPETALGVGGPLYAQGPGGLTRWMAVPWQTDTASCLSGYYLGYGPRYDPYLPTFWPARVPNQVLTLADYEIVTDPQTAPEQRREAFERRATWLRGLRGSYEEQINQMVRDFGKLGVVEEREGPEDPALPPRLLVESQPDFPAADLAPERNRLVVHVPDAADPATADAAIEAAITRTGRPEGEVVAGFINKVDRFRGRR